MKLTKNKKIIISVLASLLIMMSVFGSIFIFGGRNNHRILADDTNLPDYVSIRKVKVLNDTILEDDANTHPLQPTSINNDSFMLEKKNDTLGHNNNYDEKLLLTFNIKNFSMANGTVRSDLQYETTNDTTIKTLQVSAKLNGVNFPLQEEIIGDGLNTNKCFYQIFDLSDINNQGQYEITFTYMKSINNITMEQETSNVKFNLLDYDYYNTDTPVLSNTEKIVREKYENEDDDILQTEMNFFDYQSLDFPVLTYDANKYYLTYTKGLYGITSNYIVKVDNGKLNRYVVKSQTPVSDKTNELDGVKLSVNEDGIAQIEIRNIGEYNFYFNYILKNGDNSFYYDSVDENNFAATAANDLSWVKTHNWSKMGDVKLYNYGYQLYYSNYSNPEVATNLEFRSDELSLNENEQFTDMTYLNQANLESVFDAYNTITIENNLTTSKPSPSLLLLDEPCSTNQAPVTMKYYAAMDLKEADAPESFALKFNSYADYDNYINGSNNVYIEKLVNLTNNSRFTANGYYLVFIKYTFENYQILNESDTPEGASAASHYQFFSFAINNKEPKIEVNKLVDNVIGNKIEAGTFTNTDVIVNWTPNTAFDILPKITVTKSELGKNNPVIVYSQDLAKSNNAFVKSNGIEVVDNVLTIKRGEFNVNTLGHYNIKINYGPNETTVVNYKFTIDYEDIKDINFYSIQSLSDTTLTQVALNNTNDENPIINSAFVLDWANKNSGAKISVEYNFLPLKQSNVSDYNELNEIFNSLSLTEETTINSVLSFINSELNGKKLNLYNGYYFDTIDANIPYSKPLINNKKIESGSFSSVKSNAGIYLFTLTDEAGNINKKCIFVDNSKPLGLVYIENETTASIITDDLDTIASNNTLAIWGDNKAIQIKKTINNSNSVEAILSLLKEFKWTKLENELNDENLNNENYLLVNIKPNDIKITEKIGSDAKEPIKDAITSYYKVFNIKISNDKTKNNRLLEIAIVDESMKYGYTIENYLPSFIGTPLTFNNINKSSIEMNTDNSLLKAFTTNEIFNEYSPSNCEDLKDYEVSNRKYLYIDWKENKDTDYEIESIIINFYPLTFDETSPFYPFGATPTTINVDLEQAANNTPIRDNSKIQYLINTGSSITEEGMYIVTRNYKHELSEYTGEGKEELDYSPRYYTFFIERNSIIDYASSGDLIGECIGYFIGLNRNNNQIEYSGEDFLISSNVLEFTTSKLPITLRQAINSLNKFDTKNKTLKDILIANGFSKETNPDIYDYQNAIINTFMLNNFKLKFKFDLGGNYEATDNQEALTYKSNGYYEVTLTDNSGYGNNNTDANMFKYEFRVNVTNPQAEFVKYEYNNDNQLEFQPKDYEGLSVNNSNMLLTWSEPNDKFEAKIDNEKYIIKFTLENKKTKTIENKLELIHSVNDGHLNFTNPTWDYYIDFNEVLNSLGEEYLTTSSKCEITIYYIGNESDYGDYFSTTKTIVFDYRKPEWNYNNLKQNDTYLNSLSSDVLENFDNYESEINFENYAFSVDSTYTLTKMPDNLNGSFWLSNMDTYKMYIRQYDKYDGYSNINNQSITTDDQRYIESKKTGQVISDRYTFFENYTEGGKNLYFDISEFITETNSSSFYKILTNYAVINHFNELNITELFNKYYEIIEQDFAGNYRVYTVFVKDDSFENTKISYKSYDDEKISVVNKDITLKTINSTTSVLDLEKLNIVNVEFNNLSYSKFYMDINITGTNYTPTTLRFKPNDDIEEFMQTLTNKFSAYDRINGNFYSVIIHTSFGEALKVEVRKPTEAFPSYSVSTTKDQLLINFTSDINKSTYISNFYVYLAQNGKLDEINHNQTKDSLLKTIINDIDNDIRQSQTTSKSYSYTFKPQGSLGGDYWVEFKDNFGRTIRKQVPIGVEDNSEKVIYDRNTLDYYDETLKHVITYTNDITTLKYQTRLYSLSVEKIKSNGEYVSSQTMDIDNEFAVNFDSITGFKTIRLITKDTDNDTIYLVKFTSSDNTTISYYIGCYTHIADYSLIKTDGTKIANNSQIDRTVYLNVENNNEIFDITITAVRAYTNNNSQLITEDLGTIYDGYNFSAIGKYTITVQNELGSKEQFVFEITKKMLTNYQVVYKVSGAEIGTLVPSQVQTIVNGETANQYFTIYETDVKINGSNGLKKELIEESDILVNSSITGTKYVYKIYSTNINDNYLEYIVINKLIANNNFVRKYNNELMINNTIAPSNQVTITQTIVGDQVVSKSAIIKLNKAYNILEGNSIYLSYYYNSEFVEKINLYDLMDNNESAKIELIDSGIYDIYISDLAGNIQLFNNSSYYKLYLINDVIFSVNNKQAVDGAVFNDDVVITLLQTSQFDKPVTITAMLNGKEITVRKINNTFTFTEFGVYNITLSTTIKTVNISTDFTFRIVNPKEAMATFEYVGLNNYEVYKVERLQNLNDTEPEDITNIIKQQIVAMRNQNNENSNYDLRYMDSITLSSLKNGIGGVGYYRIYVEARYTTAKPDQKFDFIVWLNNDNDLLIKSSINYGDTTTGKVVLTFNKNQIYNKVGECSINIYYKGSLINKIDINETTSNVNITETHTLDGTNYGEYNVKIISSRGNTLSSFMVIRKEPLNSIAILVIVLSVLVVGALVFIFIKLRKNMRIK